MRWSFLVASCAAFSSPLLTCNTLLEPRHTLREQSDLVVVVKDITVIRSHITAEFEDGAFIANGKCVGYRMRVNRINTASAFNAIWDALLFAIVGETLLPESFPKELIACIRAKDMTNKVRGNSNRI